MARKAETNGCRLGDAKMLRRTSKALLVDVDGEEHWIPFSQIHNDSELHDRSEVGESGDLVVSQWMGEKLGHE